MTDSGSAGKMSNLQLRIISALVLAVVVLAITFAGGLPFRLLAAAIAGAMFYEWCAMTRATGNARQQFVASAFLAAIMLGAILGYSSVSLLILLLFSTMLSAVECRVSGQNLWVPAGLLYCGLSGISLAYLRGADAAGLTAILFLFAVVWTTDICAYFVGRSVGGPKLAPAISPGKTQSGALGGAVGGVLAGYAVTLYAGLDNLFPIALVAFFLSLVSQAGDLFESWVKRRHGVKDSGGLIPGHGGVMDRADGLVAAAFALYAIGLLLAGGDIPAQALFGK